MKYVKQLAIIIFICLVGEIIVQFFPFSFPGNIMAMILLTILLLTKVLTEDQIKEVGDFLLQIIALFILPVSVSMIEHIEVIMEIGIPLILVSLLILILSFITCVYTIRFTLHLMNKRGEQ